MVKIASNDSIDKGGLPGSTVADHYDAEYTERADGFFTFFDKEVNTQSTDIDIWFRSNGDLAELEFTRL